LGGPEGAVPVEVGGVSPSAAATAKQKTKKKIAENRRIRPIMKGTSLTFDVAALHRLPKKIRRSARTTGQVAGLWDGILNVNA